MESISDFKIRCSAINAIVTKPRKKDDIVSAGAKTYCKKWLIEQLYGRKDDVSSKYIEKGNIMEDNSIDFISNYLKYNKYGFLIKNDVYFENDYMSGTPDVITDNEIIEVKNSWDCFTFPLFEDQIPNKGYFYQVQGYMHLTGIKKAKLVYTLMDTPEHLISKEYKYNGDNNFLSYDEFKKKYLYNNIDEKYRIKIFEINYDENIINEIVDRVESCRKYIDELLKITN